MQSERRDLNPRPLLPQSGIDIFLILAGQGFQGYQQNRVPNCLPKVFLQEFNAESQHFDGSPMTTFARSLLW